MKGFERELEECGFSGFLTKPIDVDALLPDLAQRLGASRVEGSAAPAVAAAGADTARRSARAWRATPSWAASWRALSSRCRSSWRRWTTALAGGDMAELAALAHWLKGAGGSMGYDALFEPARTLEDAAKASDAGQARAALQELQGLDAAIQRGAAAARAQEQGVEA